ncbi:MAG: HD domain-containing protein [Myxococcales bacterium]|nr:HD domain-containing protein [Myxococcales bacterium]
MKPGPAYSTRLDEALGFVADAFRHRARKGSGVPYLSHLLAVAACVSEHGGDEEQTIAALCHDYLEDIPGADAALLESRFGARVARLVVGLSDSVTQPKPPWKERKLAYLAKLRDEPDELKLISAADKLHNASAILRDHRAIGEAVWDRFTATRDETLWYYRGVLSALGTGWNHPLLDELSTAVRAMHAAAGTPLD